jgi:hypothetical protein
VPDIRNGGWNYCVEAICSVLKEQEKKGGKNGNQTRK